MDTGTDPRAVNARDQTRAHWILADEKDHWNRRARGLHRQRGRIAGGDDQRRVSLEQVGGKWRQFAVVALCPAILDGDVDALDITHPFEPATKSCGMSSRFARRARAEEADG